jgi:ABC-2 type transport system permease protein
MSTSRVLSIARHETRIMKTDPWVVVILIVISGLLLAFFSDGMVGGLARAVPGMASLFGFFGLSAIGLAFYRDDGCKTWDRLLASGTRPVDVVVGKLLPLAVVFLLQYALLLPLGWAVFGLPFRGSVLGAALVAVVLVAVELGLGLLLSVVCSAINQFNAFVSLGALLLVGVGGALSPVEAFPGWVQAIAPASAVYWSLKGFQTVLTGGGGARDVLGPVGVHFGMLVGCIVLSAISTTTTSGRASSPDDS